MKLSKGNIVFLLNSKIYLLLIRGLKYLSDFRFKRFIYFNLLSFSINSIVRRLILILINYLAVLVKGILLANIRASKL